MNSSEIVNLERQWIALQVAVDSATDKSHFIKVLRRWEQAHPSFMVSMEREWMELQAAVEAGEDETEKANWEKSHPGFIPPKIVSDPAQTETQYGSARKSSCRDH